MKNEDLLKIVKMDPNRKVDPKTTKELEAYGAFMQKLKEEGKLSEYLAKIRESEKEYEDELDVLLK